MAPVMRWVFVPVVGCVVLALAYLPPRGGKSNRSPRFFAQIPQGTPARQRAQALAYEWRGAAASLRVLSLRRELTQRVQAQRDSGKSLLVLAESSNVLLSPPPLLEQAAQLAWRQLGLGETKVGVILVLTLAIPSQRYDRPVAEEGVAAYLAPDSTDRTTCVALLPAGRYWTRYFIGNLGQERRLPFDVLIQSLEAGLGPCAFYAVYGTPGKTVRGWLTSYGWDLARTLDAGPRARQGWSLWGADPRYSWYWEAVYSLPPSAVACLAGRATACSAVVLAGATDDPAIPLPDIIRTRRRWDQPPRLVEAQRFLGDVAHAVGRDRFLTFWTSTQPVDTALAAALKRPVGEWTANWERDFADPVRLGPTAPAGASGLALGLALLALGLVLFTAARRQLR